MQKFLAAIVATSLALVPNIANAQDWPNKAVTIIVPFAPGGATDITARIVGNQLTQVTGQPFVVENRAGGGGAVGATAAAKSPADGYTLLFGSSGTFSINQHLYANLEYDMERDFVPIGLATRNRHVLFVGADSEIQTIDQLFDSVRAEPGRFTYGSAGIGSGTHITAAYLASKAGLDVIHVPFGGAGPANLAVSAGEVDYGVDAVGSTLSLFKNGSLRPLAVLSKERDPQLPDVPTISETVLPDFEAGGWLAIVAPAAVPPETVEAISTALTNVLEMPETIELMTQQGLVVAPSTPEELGALITSDAEVYGALIRDAGITPQ
jgi:tripartite-type tricarboxylate transporter receptor subunit TctC